MANKKVLLEEENGDKLYLHTLTDIVFDAEGNNLDQKFSAINQTLEALESTDANAEIIGARTSGLTDKAFNNLGDRINYAEIAVGTTIAPDKKSKINFYITDEETTETWSDSVKLGDLNAHNTHTASHSDIRESVHALVQDKADKATTDELTEQIDVLEEKVNNKPNGWKNESALPNEYPEGVTLFTSLGTWNGATAWQVETKRTATHCVQTITNVNGVTYKRTANHDLLTWNGDFVEQATTEKTEILQEQIDDLEEKISWMPEDWKTEEDLPSTYNNGDYYREYYFVAKDNVFAGRGSYTTIHTIFHNANFAYQYAYARFDMAICYRTTNGNNIWGEWKTLATTEKAEILLPLNEEYEFVGGWGNQKIYRTQDNVVTISCAIERVDGGDILDYAVLFQLPAGYRNVFGELRFSADVFSGKHSSDHIGSCLCYIALEGNVGVRMNKNVNPNKKIVFINITYVGGR